MPARVEHLPVTRTARYCALGAPSPSLRQVWFVLHGFGQLAPYFIRHFAPLDDGTRLIVAPEALNRFYLEPTSFEGATEARVGATWMTREDRLTDIADYVAYLDRLYEHVLGGLDRAALRVVVLGFSQGVSTACRWLCQGRARAESLVLWAGPLPPELDHAAAAPLRAMTVHRVLGDGDEMAAPRYLEAEAARAAALGIPSAVRRFDGGHQLDGDVLRSLAV